MAAETLGDLLPPEQSSMLTERAKKMTKEELEQAINHHPDIGMYFEDMSSLRKLAITRVNIGETPFTWSEHNFSSADKDPQYPSTCDCFI